MGGDNDNVLSTSDQVHSAAHAGNQLAGDDVGSQRAFLINLQSAQNGSINVTAADQTEGNGRIEERSTGNHSNILTTGVGTVDIFVLSSGSRAHAHDAVLRLEDNTNVLRQIVGNHLRHTDTQVDNVTILQEASSALRDYNLCVFH